MERYIHIGKDVDTGDMTAVISELATTPRDQSTRRTYDLGDDEFLETRKEYIKPYLTCYKEEAITLEELEENIKWLVKNIQPSK